MVIQKQRKLGCIHLKEKNETVVQAFFFNLFKKTVNLFKGK